MNRSQEAVWHRALIAWGLIYFGYAATLRPPYPFAEITSPSWLYPALAVFCGVSCIGHVVVNHWRRLPVWTDWALLGVLSVFGFGRAFTLLENGGTPSAFTWAMLAIAQVGMYSLASLREDA